MKKGEIKMDYKEEYQKALERAKKGLPIDEVFPELKESEDEKTRKELIEALKQLDREKCPVDTYPYQKWISYLEKQKEQNPEDKDRYMEGYMNGMNDALKEQQPAEYEKPLLSKFEQAVYDCAWGKITCKPEGETQEEYARRWAEHLLLMVRDWADDYIDSQIESAKRKAYDRGKADAEQPAEWSKKDKDMLLSAMEYIQTYPAHRQSVVDWLKNLPNRFCPQPKQEREPMKIKYRGKIYQVHSVRAIPGGIPGYIIEDELGGYVCITNPEEVIDS